MAPIELNDLPEFLAQDKTNLILHNPQIYLSVSNPLGADRLDSRTGMRLTALRDNQQPEAFTLDRFTIGHSRGEGPYNFCLSPRRPGRRAGNTAAGWNTSDSPRSATSLSGKGLPKSIGVDLISPKVPMQNVAGFRLGRDLPRMEGTYRLLAPLALTGDAHSGSVIYYTDRKDGWNDEDIDAIVISTMKLTTEVSSTLPLNAVLTAHPLDKDGRVMRRRERNRRQHPGQRPGRRRGAYRDRHRGASRRHRVHGGSASRRLVGHPRAFAEH